MAAVGSACLFVGLLSALWAVGASLYGARTGRRRYVVSARRAVYSLAGLLALAFALLEAAYLRSDFSFALVAQSSSASTPTFYKLTAMWSSQEGSLLLWVTVLAIFSSAVLYLTRDRHREIVPYATAVLGGIAVFFLTLTVFFESPFTQLASPPSDGAGLNPLLRHPAMMIHPPMLYSGYVGFSIPFAFAIGALITRRTGADWIRSTRRFALVAWTFLGMGILLGALWSFAELGWGGYWAWDPVENASLLPWLTGTAFLHSIMVQEKRGMLKVWNVSLVIATFVLALLGTFLVRSGILDSIHAFGASTLGAPFLTFIGAVLAGSVALVLARLDSLRSEARLDSLVSREAVFLLNNLVLVGLAAVILWGTYFPIISEALTGTRRSLLPPWFNGVTTPLAIVLVLLAGIGPVLAWRRATLANLRRAFAAPVAAALVVLAALLALTDAASSATSLMMFTLVAFSLAVVAQEFWRGGRARRVMSGEAWPAALASLVARNRRRYGGYLAHAGIALLFLGIAASSAFVEQRDVRLGPGQTARIGDYEVTYRRPTAGLLADRAGTGAPITFGAVLDVRRDGERFSLHPSRNYYPSQDGGPMGTFGRFFNGEATSEVGLRWGLRRDVWTAMQPDLRSLMGPIREANRRFAGADPEIQAVILAALVERYRREAPPATFRVLVSPLVAWIWIGGAVVGLGALTALWPSAEARRRRVTSVYAARLGRELSRA
ncbi:MAG: cytochrome c biogenesis protein CcsA [Actinomycetota bacterium]|nr:cytochrome c biogenesis protein CcsA [Actinomycetota bacterium]